MGEREKDGCRLEKLEIIDFVSLMSVIFGLCSASWHIRQMPLIPSIFFQRKVCQDFFYTYNHTQKNIFFSYHKNIFFFFFLVFRSKCITFFMFHHFFSLLLFLFFLSPRWIILHFCRHHRQTTFIFIFMSGEISNFFNTLCGILNFFEIFKDSKI